MKLNMPIWRVMCFQSPGVWSLLVRRSYRALRMSMIRYDMVLTSFFHSSNIAGSFRSIETWGAKQIPTHVQSGTPSATFHGLQTSPRPQTSSRHTHDSAAKGRWVGDLASLEHAQLAEDLLRLLAVLADNVEAADPLAVQTRVLGVRLADEEWDPLSDKVTDRPCIIVEIAGLGGGWGYTVDGTALGQDVGDE